MRLTKAEKQDQKHIKEWTKYFDFSQIKKIVYTKIAGNKVEYWLEIRFITKNKEQVTGSIEKIEKTGIEVYLY